MSNFVANNTVVCRLCSRHWGSTSVVYAGCSLLSKLTLKWHTLDIILTCLKKNKQSQIASWRWPRQRTTKLDQLGCKQSQVMLSWKQNTLNKEHPTRTGARLEPHLREAEKSITRVCPNWFPTICLKVPLSLSMLSPTKMNYFVLCFAIVQCDHSGLLHSSPLVSSTRLV